MQDEDPRIWGPAFWMVMRKIAEKYPDTPSETLKVTTKVWYESFQELLPCHKCRKHYQESLIKNPIDSAVNSGTSLKEWVEKIKKEIDLASREPAVVPTPAKTPLISQRERLLAARQQQRNRKQPIVAHPPIRIPAPAVVPPISTAAQKHALAKKIFAQGKTSGCKSCSGRR